ncbi:MAG: molybdopterin biosynthesis protein [Clostridia bacterium]|nr:molybdopterin biosynthesis protein [Clostridia bacterium]
MEYQYLKNMELEEALKTYTESIEAMVKVPQGEEIKVQDALSRVTCEAVIANISSPHYNACAMDGIAVLAERTFGATETTPVFLKEGTDFVRVDTGDPLPQRFDAVVMIEDVIHVDEKTVKLMGAAVPWQHVRQIGEDICKGEMILSSNTVIEPPAMGALLAGGVLKVKVKKRLVVGLIPTGDEIVSPTDSPEEGKIIEFNSTIFAAMLTRWGCIPKTYPIVPDHYGRIREVLQKAAKECDVVILNAGSSAGREDFSAKVIGEIGKVLVHGISIRPGKPTIMGLIGEIPVIGVPGYPVSGIIVMENVVKPVLNSMLHITGNEVLFQKAVLSRKLISSLKYKELVRMKLGFVKDKWVATPLNRGAGVVTSFVKADGILEIPMNSEGMEAGKEVNVRLLKSPTEIKNTLSVTGSHDPLIDIIMDRMKVHYPGKYISSAHVGSLGGIMAIKRGEAHIAGTHLLDEETGEYNLSYVKKYLHHVPVNVVRCVKRLQGLMVKKGNPRNIKSLKDIVSEKNEIRYVNRQKGSGTRVLLDFYLRKHNLDVERIYGYNREELTHMSVAALVASESADAGLGIYSAAMAYNLDFIPLCEEQYDFIIPKEYMELSSVECFLDILKSQEFKDILLKMGGYEVSGAEEIYSC